MNQETLEEAAEIFYSEQSKAYEDATEPMFDNSRYLVAGFIDGAKWQQGRMYSEEDMQKCFHAGEMHCATEGKAYKRSANFKEWLIEQFKRK